MKKENIMKGQFPSPEKIKCKDCIYRDITVIKIGNIEKPVGVTKSWCEKYNQFNSAGKPKEILFQNEDCEFYKKDSTS